MTLAIVTTTVATKADAEALAQALVERRLAACVQLSAITSVYRWEGVERGDEVRLDCKTPNALRPALVEALIELHPYDLPEIIWREVEASEAYAAWALSVTE